MTQKRGAKSKYETHVKSRFSEIEKWFKSGATEKEVYQNLGINRSTFYDYKSKHSEFSDLIKNARKKPVEDIKAAMLKRALGFQYEERKVITQSIKFDDEALGEIPAKVIKTEITTKTALPSETAGLILLQHWAKDEGWTRDPQNLKLKKEELKIKEKKLENETW